MKRKIESRQPRQLRKRVSRCRHYRILVFKASKAIAWLKYRATTSFIRKRDNGKHQQAN